MKLIVDTNIVFSGILNTSGNIGKILTTPKQFQFYSCDFLRVEIFRHRDKLQKLTKLTEENLAELEYLVTSNITFINESLISETVLKTAAALANTIDSNDMLFVALAIHLDAILWTGDKKLLEGLRSKHFNKTITTAELVIVRQNLAYE